ncbi:MAG TPA: hypothetical protein VG897_01045 [Terriglobales bacterium]|nr:hypothetical protein [Terriglobales bacterium]
MPAEIVFVGYTCPRCGSRVAVLRSSEPPQGPPKEIISECKCGSLRRIRVEDIQELETWREQCTE